ncbi:MAG: phosphoenolpyruvate--protein phosphotransferase [Acidobacteriia bacterium]|nr:phosphoenolpyruvate--protein phosphotransferase [Terriglobia bacterium]
MVGIVLVSHSRKLAAALREMVLQMAGPELPVEIAAGVGENHGELGTDAVHISEILEPFCAGDGAVVLMDVGSAVLSAKTALELLKAQKVPGWKEKLCLCPAPIVEGAVSAAVQASTGAGLEDVCREALTALQPKREQLTVDEPAALSQAEPATRTDINSDTAAPVKEESVELDLTIKNEHGLHVRPAASLVQFLNRFHSEVELTNLSNGRGPSPGCSLTSVSLLQARRGDVLHAVIRGADAHELAAQLREFAAASFGQADAAAFQSAPPSQPSPNLEKEAARAGAYSAVGASAGIAVGPPLALQAAIPEPPEGEPGTTAEEIAKFEKAAATLAAKFRNPRARAAASSEILSAQAMILEDPVLLEAVRTAMRKEKLSAMRAWRNKSEKLALSYSAMEDQYLRARAADVRDISRSLLLEMAGDEVTSRIQPEPPAILFTDELLPSEAMACDPQHVLGVLARAGSPTAHASILMRGSGIPMVVGASTLDAARLRTAKLIALDGETGHIWLDPTAGELAEIETRRTARATRLWEFEKAKREPALTTDGARIEVLANVSKVEDSVHAAANGAEGVGLLRTEFVYLSRRKMPTEEQQTEALAAVLKPLGPGPVVVRTPDIGADKPLLFLPACEEHNPFLGVRGVRLSFEHREFFASNLRAILRAGQGRELWIMLPMVTIPEEMLRCRGLLAEAHQSLQNSGVEHVWPVRLGMMVEVPAAAIMAKRFAMLADFFSIGTNDLTQYLLAAERGNAGLSRLQDSLHPAVLRIIQQVCEAAGEYCHVSVCGDAASDPVAAALMTGAGVRSLSVRPNQIAAIKATLRRFSMERLRDAAAQALLLDDAAAVRELARKLLPELF